MSSSAYVWVALGGALGSLLRVLSSEFMARRGTVFPWGTLAVNVVGSLAIGVFAAAALPGGRLADSASAQRFLMAGVCGGFTTFSAFSLQTLELARSGQWLAASANILSSVALCLLAVWLGYKLGRALS
jgi:fluoride exporter